MTAWLDTTFDVIAVAVFGMAALAVGGWAVFHAVRQTFWWPKASARILRYWITRSSDEPEGQRFFHPVVRFETEDGRSVTTISSWGSWRRPWPIGHIVSVHYDPINPRRAEVTCIANVWGIPLTVMGLLAILALIMALRRYLQSP
jgi:hypothetical protein